MQRTIVHIDLDSFFVSVERLLNPALVGRPVIVGGRSNRGVVSSCSYEARKMGVHSAMSIVKAMKLCPEAIIVNGGNYGYYSGLVTDIIRQEAPIFEKASVDEFYLDITGMERFFGCYEWAAALRQRIIKETGLPVSFGMAGNKLVAKIATGKAKPNGQINVPHGEEAAFLAPLDVGEIPMVGEKMVAELNKSGVFKIHQLQAMPLSSLERLFGNSGQWLWDRCRGIDDRPVGNRWIQKSISQERTFGEDSVNTEFMHEMLVRMAENLGYELRDLGKMASCIAVKIRYSDFKTVSRQLTIPFTDNDQLFIKSAKELFDKLYNPALKVRLLGLRLSNLEKGQKQMQLFDNSEEMRPLYAAMDKLKDKYGKNVVGRVAGKRLGK